MTFLKWLGWIFIPYIMLPFQWKKIGKVGKIAGSVWAVVALIFAISSISNGSKQSAVTTNSPASSSQSTSEPAQKEYKIGEEVKAGNLIFKVNSVKKADQVGDEYLNKKADGVYLIVNVTVKNNDKEARTIDTNLFKLVSGSTSYNASAEADVYANKDNQFFLKQLNPGVSMTGNVVFDIPKDLKGEKLQVDSGLMFAGGKTEIIDIGQ